MPTPIYRTRSELLTSVTDALWIRTNTLADIDHLVALSGSLAAGEVHTRVEREIAATIPPLTDTTANDVLCPDNSTPSVAGTNGTTSPENQKVFWQSLLGTNDKCRPASLYAYADYTQSDLLLRQGDRIPMTAEQKENIFSTVGINITGSKYIAYNNTDLLSHLA